MQINPDVGGSSTIDFTVLDVEVTFLPRLTTFHDDARLLSLFWTTTSRTLVLKAT